MFQKKDEIIAEYEKTSPAIRQQSVERSRAIGRMLQTQQNNQNQGDLNYDDWTQEHRKSPVFSGCEESNEDNNRGETPKSRQIQTVSNPKSLLDVLDEGD